MNEVTNVTIVGRLFLGYDYMHEGTCNHVKIRLDSREVEYSINNKKRKQTMSHEDTDVLFQEITKAVQSMIGKNKRK
jgi:hypothetical protein